MLRFSLFRIPFGVDWWFWLVTAMLGGGLRAQTPDAWMAVAIWAAVVFVSIVVHELGHALMGRRFGATPAVRLHSFGGTTFLPDAHFTRKQSIFVSAAGPGASFVLGTIVWLLAQADPGLSKWQWLVIRYALYVNFFWTCLNLLPIQPLDGGQILRDLLGPSRRRMASLIGFVTAVPLCFWALSKGLLFSAVMLAMLAYYNFREEPVQGGVVKD